MTAHMYGRWPISELEFIQEGLAAAGLPTSLTEENDPRNTAEYLYNGFDLLGVEVNLFDKFTFYLDVPFTNKEFAKYDEDDFLTRPPAPVRPRPVYWTVQNYEDEARKAVEGAPEYRSGALAAAPEDEVRAIYITLYEAASRAPWGVNERLVKEEIDELWCAYNFPKDTQDDDSTAY